MKEGRSRRVLLAGMAIATACAATGFAPDGASQGPASVVLVDSTGKIAARSFAEGVVLVTDPASRVVAPASIRGIQGDDGRAVSGLATWQSGGGVLFTSTGLQHRRPRLLEQRRWAEGCVAGADAERRRAVRGQRRERDVGRDSLGALRQRMPGGRVAANGTRSRRLYRQPDGRVSATALLQVTRISVVRRLPLPSRSTRDQYGGFTTTNCGPWGAYQVPPHC